MTSSNRLHVYPKYIDYHRQEFCFLKHEVFSGAVALIRVHLALYCLNTAKLREQLDNLTLKCPLAGTEYIWLNLSIIRTCSEKTSLVLN